MVFRCFTMFSDVFFRFQPLLTTISEIFFRCNHRNNLKKKIFPTIAIVGASDDRQQSFALYNQLFSDSILLLFKHFSQPLHRCHAPCVHCLWSWPCLLLTQVYFSVSFSIYSPGSCSRREMPSTVPGLWSSGGFTWSLFNNSVNKFSSDSL